MTHDGRDLPSPLPLAQVTLADKYDLAKTRVFITGSQAITRLLLMQKARDRNAGLNTQVSCRATGAPRWAGSISSSCSPPRS